MKRWMGKTLSNVHLRVLTLYGILTILLTYPLVNYHSTAIPGTIWDNWMYYWSVWWIKKAVLDLGINPLQTDYLFYPMGAGLYFHTTNLVGAILSIPVQIAFGTTVGYNAVVFFNFIFGGYVTYLLGYYLFADSRPAFLTGLAFTFSAIHLAHGQQLMDLSSVQWLSLSMIFLLKVVKDQRTGLSFLTAFSLFIASITAWYFALSLFAFAILLGGWSFAQRGWSQSRRVLTQLALMVGIYIILISPMIIPMLVVMRQPNALEATRQTLVFNSADILDFIVAHDRLSIWGDRLLQFNKSISMGPHVGESYNIYLGLLVMGLAILGIRKWPRRVWFWLMCFLLFLALSLGPNLHVGGRDKFFDFTIPLGYGFLYDLQVGKIARAPIRQAIMTTLMLDILAGYGFAWILSTLANKRRTNLISQMLWSPKIWTGLVGVLICFDSMSIPVPLSALPNRGGCTPNAEIQCLPLPGYGKLSRTSGGVVLDIPAIEIKQTHDLWIPVTYMAAQTIHQKRIIGGRLARDPLYSFWGNVPPEFRRTWNGMDDDILHQSDLGIVSMLDYFDIRYYVLHRSIFKYAEITEQKIIERLNELYGARIARFSDVEQTAIYSVEQSAPAAFPFVVLWNNWYDREKFNGKTTRWMANDATLKVVNPYSEPTTLFLGFEAVSLLQMRNLEIHLDDQVIDILTMSPDGWQSWHLALTLSPGEHVLLFHSLQQSQKPPNSDMRLLSIAFASLNAEFK